VAPAPGHLGRGPGSHAVLFYYDVAELAGQVSDYALAAIRERGMAIVIATPAHRHMIADRLVQAGLDLAAARANGSYLPLDARETMRRFMADDWPSPASFWQAVSPMVARATETGRPVHVFGEMVSLLWDAGLVNAAIEVEAMWNELGAQYPFSLLCAYPAGSPAGDHHQDALAEVCRVHSAVLGAAPDLGAVPGPGQPGRG